MFTCYCGLLKSYQDCCGPYIDAGGLPLSPEALMRSRYSAYAQAKVDYIVETMRGAALEGFDPVEAKAWAERVEWLGFIVLKARYSVRNSNKAQVEFKAYYREGNVEQCLHELSDFERLQGRWFYTSGKKPLVH